MATETWKPLHNLLLGVPYLLTAAAQVIYQCPNQPQNRVAKVTGIHICNTDTVQRTFTICNDQTCSAANAFFFDCPIQANTTYSLNDPDGIWILGASPIVGIGGFGSYLSGKADVTNKVTVYFYGCEIQ